MIKGKRFIVGIHREVVARIVRSDSRASTLHLIENLVHYIALNNALLLFQQGERTVPCREVVGVYA